MRLKMNTPRRGWRRGFSQAELIIALGVLGVAVLGFVLTVTWDGSEDDHTELGVPVYRVANAMYAHNMLENQRVAIMSFMDKTGSLPGDISNGIVNSAGNLIGNNNQRIEKENEEHLKVFKDMHGLGMNPREVVRIRGKNLQLYWMELFAGEKLANEGNFFKLSGFNADEAKAMDWKFDDGWSDTGDIVYAKTPEAGDGVELYVKLILF